MFQDVLNFWFHEIDPAMWWQKSAQFDAQINQRFGDLHRQAVLSELYSWRDSAQSALAEILVLDQFSRNIYRDQPQSFAADSMALALAQAAVREGYQQQLSPTETVFLYLPYMHSESLLIHEQAVKLYTELGKADNLEFEHKHKAIIERFGRYPHRNKILGRASTPEEEEFLEQPGSSF